MFREDGSLFALEVTSAWISFRPPFRALRSVPGITNLKRNCFNEDRASFMYGGERWVVNEPFGDNSRYWIGPERGRNSALDARPVHEAFQKLETFRYRLWRRFSRPEGA